MSILIKNTLVNGSLTDIAVEGSRITRIAPGISGTFDTVLDGSRHAAVPPFYNTHNHAAMTLLRGYADDMMLFDWLQNHIWPAESRMSEESVYWGSRLACLEMIRTGTVFFNDMYLFPKATIRAAEEMGMRACIGLIQLETSEENARKQRLANEEFLAECGSYSSRIQLCFAPHAVYTVAEKSFRNIVKEAERYDLGIHLHLSETMQEVNDCMAAHGCSPVEYLDRMGVLNEKTLAAHSVHLSESDMEIYRKRNVIASYMPCSNAKLVSGQFQFKRMMEKGIRITLGTDGCSSNNNLSMFDEMKFGALSAKLECKDPTGCPAEQIYAAATRNGAEAFHIDAGIIQEGKLADILLVDLDNPMLTPAHNLISNLVYSADSSCVSTVICNGRILMQDRTIPGAEEILENARRCARALVK